jgi:hypothetical protein
MKLVRSLCLLVLLLATACTATPASTTTIIYDEEIFGCASDGDTPTDTLDPRCKWHQNRAHVCLLCRVLLSTKHINTKHRLVLTAHLLLMLALVQAASARMAATLQSETM